MMLNHEPSQDEGQDVPMTLEEAEIVIRSSVRQMQEAIKNLRLALYSQGRAATDLYVQMARENAFTPQETRIFPRVRIDKRYGTPSFSWERMIRHVYPVSMTKPLVRSYGRGRSYEALVRRKGSSAKEKMRVVLLSEHIPITKKTLSVSMHVFDKEPEWVRLAAQLVEPELALLREKNRALSNVSRAIIHFSRLLEKMDSGKK